MIAHRLEALVTEMVERGVQFPDAAREFEKRFIARVLAAMLEDGISGGQGSTYFLTSLLEHPDFDPERHIPLMPFVGLGGSPVPAAVGERCAAMGIEIVTAAFVVVVIGEGGSGGALALGVGDEILVRPGEREFVHDAPATT